jgi:amino acid adenylation domain-containing protein
MIEASHRNRGLTPAEKRARLAEILRKRAQEPLSFPLSFAQERLWFLDQLTPGDPSYNIPAAARIGGPLNRHAFEQGVTEIVRRHEVLRTNFAAVGGRPVQSICANGPVNVPVVSLRALPADGQEQEVSRLAIEHAVRPFDLERGSLLRITLLELDDHAHVALMAIHHIVADGWSVGVVMQELMVLYTAFGRGRASSLQTLSVQYADYAVWQREVLTRAQLVQGMEYWRPRLERVQTLNLPTDRPRSTIPSVRGAACLMVVDSDLVDRLREVGRREGATLFMTLLAAFAVVLARYTEQEDFCIGTPTANRTRREVEGLIGHFVNTLAIRVDLRGDPSFAEVLRRVREAAVGAYAHQEVPFEKLVAELQPARDWSRNPLFDVMFVLQNTPMPTLGLEGLEVSWLNVPNRSSNFDVTLSLMEVDGALTGGLEYSPDLFDAKRMERLAGHLRQVLQGVAAGAAATAIWRVPLLTADERRELAGWSGAERGEASEAVMAAVAAQAARTPDAIAVAEGRRQLSYETLWARMAGLAERLTTGGVGPEVRVGVYVERSVEQVVAVGGVLAAGGVLVPLDPGAPRGRVAAQVADAGVQTMVTRRSLAAQVPAGPAVVLVEEGGAATGSAWPRASWPTQAAYVMYTSGSTGRPKGVVVEQGALAAYVATARVLYGVEARDRCLQFAALTFDTSVEEIWPCLVAGGRLVLRTEPMVQTPATFLAACAAAEVTVLNLPTAYWQAVVADQAAAAGAWPAAIRLVIIGGERAERRPWVAWQQWVGPGVALQNTYGPTETTVVATAAAVSAPTMCPAGAEVPIGRPLAHARVYVLDRWGEPVPIGVPGEICIGGAAVARGYWRQPGLTAEQFVPDPWAAQPGARLYRTGDWGRYRADGHLEYVGRRDRQVKLRGHRIELAEIEAAIRAHEKVAEAVVELANESDAAQLVALVVPRAGRHVTGATVRRWLRERLPAALVPPRVVVAETAPRLASGKVNRRAVAALGCAASPEAATDYVAPRTPVEEFVAAMWADVLGLARVGITETFFDLGGHSLQATQILARIQRACRVELTLRQFFGAPTVQAVAALIVAAPIESATGPALEQHARERAPLSFAQERLWLLDQLAPNQAFYNVPAMVRLRGPLLAERLVQSTAAVVRRHSALRSTLQVVGGVPHQAVARPVSAVAAQFVDLTRLDPMTRETELERLAYEEACRPFDLSRGPLYRIRLIRLDADEHVVLATVHHIVADAWSIGVFLRELGALYAACAVGLPLVLPELPVQYADYAVWQRERLRGGVLEHELGYWREQLHDAPLLALRTDHPRPPVQGFRTARHQIVIDAEVSRALEVLSRREEATLFMTLLAAFTVLLARETGQTDLVVGTPIAGRTRVELEGLIGFFVNTLVLRTDLGGDPDFLEVLRRVRRRALEAFSNQHVPFEKLVAECRPPRDPSRNPIVQVLFVLQNAPVEHTPLAGVEVLDVQVREGTSNFDLTLSLTMANGRLQGVFAYAPELFEPETIARMAANLKALLAHVATNPVARVWVLPLPGDSYPEPRRTDADSAVAIPRVPTGRPDPAPFVPPQTTDEVRLARILSEALQVDRVGVTDDFFELGGYSMLAVQVLARISNTVGILIPLKVFFDLPSVSGLVAYIVDHRRDVESVTG